MKTLTSTGLETLTCYKPRNFNLSDIPAPVVYKRSKQVYVLDEKFNQRHEHKYLFLLSNIIFKQIRTKKKFEAAVTLDSIILKKLYGDHYYKTIIDCLIKARYIERVGNHIKGYKSTSYKITAALIENGFEIVDITNRALCYKISKFSTEQLENILDQDNNAHLFYTFTNVGFLEEQAIAYVMDKYKNSIIQRDCRLANIHAFCAVKDASTKTNLASGIKKLNFPFARCRAGRIHSPSSQLPKDLLKFIDGIGFELDAACSQLNIGHDLMLKLVIELHESMKRKKVHHIGEGDTLIDTTTLNEPKTNNFRNLEEGNSIKERSSTYVVHFSNPLNVSELLKIDVQWRNAITNGTAYEYLMSAFKYKGNRDKFKEDFFKNIFYNVYRKPLNKMEQQFKLLCPNEFNRIRYIKSILGNSELAVLITRHESRFWIAAINRIMKERFSDVLYLNRHDAIMLPKDKVEQIHLVIESEYHKYLSGRKAVIRIKSIS